MKRPIISRENREYMIMKDKGFDSLVASLLEIQIEVLKIRRAIKILNTTILKSVTNDRNKSNIDNNNSGSDVATNGNT